MKAATQLNVSDAMTVSLLGKASAAYHSSFVHD